MLPPRRDPDERVLAHRAARNALVSQLAKRGDIRDPRVLQALARVPRELFVSSPWEHAAYYDSALPIECDQTISQPYVVALMTQLVEAGPGRRILEIGTGSGYQAAILAATGAEVFSMEIIEALALQAQQRFAQLFSAGSPEGAPRPEGVGAGGLRRPSRFVSDWGTATRVGRKKPHLTAFWSRLRLEKCQCPWFGSCVLVAIWCCQSGGLASRTSGELRRTVPDPGSTRSGSQGCVSCR